MTNGAEDENAAADQPTEPNEPAASAEPSPPPQAEGAPPSGTPARGGWVVPKWAVAALVGLVAVAILFGSGFGIGRATSSGGDDNGRAEQGFEGRFPRDPGDLPRIPRPSGVFLGVSTENATGDVEGVRIASVEEDSPAAGAGLQEGDVITAVDGEAVTSPADLAQEIRSHDPGDQVTVAYSRDGNPAEVQVELADRSAENEPAS
jgi:membrane-associated protease RseP (regulator of RpoE activity)